MAKINDLIAKGELEAASVILYDALLQTINKAELRMHISREEWKKISPVLIQKMMDPGIGVPEEPVIETGELVIKYTGPIGGSFKAPNEVRRTMEIGKTYAVETPIVDGFVADRMLVEGTMVAGGVVEEVKYVPATAKLEIIYDGPVGGSFVAPDPVEMDVMVGTGYKITSPSIDGYMPDKNVVEGTMVSNGVSEIVTYALVEAVSEG